MNNLELDSLIETFYPGTAEEIRKRIADLRIQAMMFDMDVDIETLELVPKTQQKEAVWLTRWLNRFNEGDNFPETPEQNLEEDI